MQASLVALATAAMLTMTMCAYDGRSLNRNDDAEARPTEMTAEHDQVMSWTLAPASRIRLAGRATIGSWDCVGQRAEAELVPGAPLKALIALVERVEADPSLTADELALDLKRAPAASLAVRIDALGCGNQAMERDMHDALKAEAHPEIRYTLADVNAVRLEREADGDESTPFVFLIDTVGELSLAGVTQEVQMQVEVRRVGDHRFAVLGSKRLNMHDFDIEPPTALLGLIRADPQVEVVFDLVVEPAVEAPTDEDPDRP